MTTESKDPPVVLSVLLLVMGVGIIGGAGYMYMGNPDRSVLFILALGVIGSLFTLLAIKSLGSSDTYETVSKDEI